MRFQPRIAACFLVGVLGSLAPLAVAGDTTPVARPAATSLKVDAVAKLDGPIKTDGAKDAVLDLTIDGPVTSLLVMAIDEKTGTSTKGQQWDTFVGDQPIPKALGSEYATGAPTWQLGVDEGGTSRNTAQGTLAPLGSGTHKLTLSFSDNGALKTLIYVVVAGRPDGTVARSNRINF